MSLSPNLNPDTPQTQPRDSNRVFWATLVAGALIVTFRSVELYGPIGVPLGIGTGASLGIVVYYLGAMVGSAARWIRQKL